MTYIATVVQYDAFYFNPGMGIQLPAFFTCPDKQLAADTIPAKQPPQHERSLQAIGTANTVPFRHADKPAYAQSLIESLFRPLCFLERSVEKEI
jgi:hypothetical protein